MEANAPSPSKISNSRGWDIAIARFLKNAGLTQAYIGFGHDMLVMNTDSVKRDVLPALERLRDDLTKITQMVHVEPELSGEQKLRYVELANGATPATPSQLTRAVSSLIAQNRARNNISNRNEFLRKQRTIVVTEEAADGTSTVMEVDAPSCARTDAVPIDRNVQMKYDVAKNEGGPLRRTIKAEQQPNVDVLPETRTLKGKAKAIVPLDDADVPTLQRHSGLRERFSNIEDHLAVRYVPSPPVSLLDRIRFLEEHIIRLERDYPPWAALHFRQPNRGWPPPPRETPLIIPTHLTSSTSDPHQNDQVEHLQSNVPNQSRGSAKQKTKTRSSLHKAVMQKLEVKKAMAGAD